MTPVSICKGCSRPIIILYNSFETLRPSNQTTKILSWLQPSLVRTNRRSFGTTKARAAFQKPQPKPSPSSNSTSKPSRAAPVPPRSTIVSPAASLQSPRLSYAQKLAAKSSSTTLYEAGPNRAFLFSSYTAGLSCIAGAAVNVLVNVYNVPPGLHFAVPVAFGAVGIAMVYIGTRFALMPAGAIHSIKVLPARSAKASAQAAKATPLSASVVPVRLEIEARRSLPIPGLPLRRFEVDPNNVIMKAPMYNRKAAPSDYEKMLMKQEEAARRQKERDYEMSHLLTAPFRHAARAFGIFFANFRRGLTGEGFAPVIINGVKYKLDITSAYVLEEGRALDRIVRIEEDPALARLAAKKRQP
ncbi:hypothetical protein K449DRAFT_434253 [Hypoxylon sp. EC38]|nr:hypothetical protein K449DRAFT_434253 [Hypoxylon sp. EC38]